MNGAIDKVVLIGAGNVATHLGRRLVTKGIEVQAAWSRRINNAQRLANQLGCTAHDDFNTLPKQSDLYLLLVPDNAITATAMALAAHIDKNALVVHTSGATPSAVLAPYCTSYGVFYPLQTFSAQRNLTFDQVPLCVYAPQEEDQKRLFTLAQQLVNNAYLIDDAQRSQLHLAAVFVNNFTNHLQHIGRTLVEEKGIDPLLLQPLLQETVAKLNEMSPLAAQTGPAIRNDQVTIKRHLQQLEDHPAWQALYQLFSRLISTNGKEA